MPDPSTAHPAALRRARCLSAAQLREKAIEFRLEASEIKSTIPLIPYPERDMERARMNRMKGVAADLERAAQRLEASSQ